MDIKQFQGMMDMVLKNKEGKVLNRSEGEAVLKGLASVTITIFAAVLAISAWLGGQVSGKILANNVELNDTWAFYQAKSIKQNLYFVNMEDIKAQLEDPTTPPNVRKLLAERADRYQSVVDRLESDPKGDGKQQIMAKARTLESERDLLKKRSPFFGMASTVLQIAIVLSTTAILAVSMALWYGSIGVGIIGLLILADGMWYFFPLPF
jgi:hypothetical protein